MIVLHQRARASISGPQLAKWGGETRALVEQVNVNSAATVQTFLENAGQRDLLGEEVGRSLNQLNTYLNFYNFCLILCTNILTFADMTRFEMAPPHFQVGNISTLLKYSHVF